MRTQWVSNSGKMRTQWTRTAGKLRSRWVSVASTSCVPGWGNVTSSGVISSGHHQQSLAVWLPLSLQTVQGCQSLSAGLHAAHTCVSSVYTAGVLSTVVCPCEPESVGCSDSLKDATQA